MRPLALAAAGSIMAACAAASAQDMGHGLEPMPTVFSNIGAELDYSPGRSGLLTWDIDGWVGGDSERVWLRSEGEIEDGRTRQAEAEIYYGWNFDPFWDVLVGVRQDIEPASTSYLAAGIVGLAKYDFETEASLFLSARGDLSARVSQSFDLFLTQRLVAQPYLSLHLHAQDVTELNVGAGLAEAELGLQLRYEFARRFAPYIDAVWRRKLGESAGLARAAGEAADRGTIRFGLRIWF